MKIALFILAMLVLILSGTWCVMCIILEPIDWVSFWFGFPWVLAAAEALYISLEDR